ncbi:hypothetical protein [Acinetobacter sp. 1000160]|uniref:hypothetical protein n=1 Tax=Acinetobacter sp. 1000160 TaxID=1310800 RepID=UPI00044837C0|nr:hypothetical protein [Acinetobacter sp. 1000160]EYT17885.1 hypothetical protein J699_02763 [Acinetobacter sp. 1000160]
MAKDPKIENLKIEVINKLDQLNKRKFPANKIADVFRPFHITGRGRHGLINAVRGLDKGDVLKDLNEVNCELKKILDKHVAFFNKKILLYKVDSKIIEDIEDKLKNEALKFNLFESEFNHSPATTNDAVLAKAEELDSGTIYYFKSERHYYRTVPETVRSVDEFSLEFPDAVVVGISKKLRFDLNAFDFIKIDHKHEIIVIGIDLINVFDRALSNIKIEDYKTIIKRYGMLDQLNSLNLRKIIPEMEVESSATGRVVNHDFSTGKGGYTYLGRSGKKLNDMRDDKFFQEGSKSQILDFFGIDREYNVSDEEKPIISLGLTEAEFRDSTHNPVNYAILDHLDSYKGLQYCIDKIMTHLHKVNK